MCTRRSRVLALCALFTGSADVLLAAGGPPAQIPALVGVGVPAPTPPKQHAETEIVTLAMGGATPAQISRTSGKFFLEVNNRMANPALATALELLDGAGTVVPSAVDSNSLQHRRLSVSLIDLPPGDYRLQVAANARVLCQIHIGK